MKKMLTAITVAIGTLVLAIPASGFNVTISADADNNPWACYALPGTTLPGGHPWLPWGTNNDLAIDVPTGSYNWTGKWAQYHNAVTFDVDGSGLIQNIQPSWGANGAGTSTLNITGPEVHYGFFGNARTGLLGLNGPGHKGWDGIGDHVETSIWPTYTGRSYTWRHNDAPDPPAGEIWYLSFRMNENAEVYDIQPETAGAFSINASGRAFLDSDDGGLECGGSYVQGEPALVEEQDAISATVVAAINAAVADLQTQIENVELTPGPTGDQGATGATGGQGPQGKIGADGAAAPCVDCQAISDAAFNLACIQLAASPATTVSDFQSSVDALATVATVGSGGNICQPIPGGAATCMDYINDQAQAIYDSK